MMTEKGARFYFCFGGSALGMIFIILATVI